MDGRDFGPPRSVHGPPPPLLSGLAMDSHRVGAATAGRLPASGLPGPLPPGKYMAGLNLHPHPGKCPMQCPPPLVPSGSCAGGRPGEAARSVPPSPRSGDSAPPSPPTGTQGAHGVWAGPGGSLGPGRTGALDFVAFPSASSSPEAVELAETGAPRGDSKPGAPVVGAWTGVFKIWARKEQTPLHTLWRRLHQSCNAFLGKCPFRRRASGVGP